MSFGTNTFLILQILQEKLLLSALFLLELMNSTISVETIKRIETLFVSLTDLAWKFIKKMTGITSNVVPYRTLNKAITWIVFKIQGKCLNNVCRGKPKAKCHPSSLYNKFSYITLTTSGSPSKLNMMYLSLDKY